MKLSDTLRFRTVRSGSFWASSVSRSIGDQIVGIYTSAIFEETKTLNSTKVVDRFTIDLKARKVATIA